MKHQLFLSLVLILAGFGCVSSAPVLVNDFEPPHAKASLPEAQTSTIIHPLQNSRLQTAISYDGLTYISNDVWISDQANGPDAVVTPDGTIYLYYSGWIVGNRLNTSAVAISSDAGRTWNYRYLELAESDFRDRFLNPDVVLLNDGTFRMFFTAGNAKSIHYAESSDGTSFVYKGPVFTPRDDIAVDSTTFKFGDTWHMYARSNEGVSRLWHLTGTDGVNFSVYDLTSFPVDEVPLMPTNGVWVKDVFHLFLSGEDGSIYSMQTMNGSDWYPDNGPRLSPETQDIFAQDTTAVPLHNGQTLMIYSTNVSES